MTSQRSGTLQPPDDFSRRHIGPGSAEIGRMLDLLGYDSLDALGNAAIPESIRLRRPLQIDGPRSEYEVLRELRSLGARNRLFRSYLGLGYYDCLTPPVIQRNILESPGWYTAYTPYQPEIAQGRLEALLNFQTMVIDLTALPIANASLLDEATAAAEAMAMSHALRGGSGREVFFVSEGCYPQTIDVVRTRARARGIELVVGDHHTFEFRPQVFGALVQYPAQDGALHDYADFCARAHAAEALVTAAADLLALTLLRPPGEWGAGGADIAVGSTQRFGVPLGYGGPHAAYLAARDEFRRQLPGRIIGVSRDAAGRPGLRMALQTREQHIRRERATSNICTAQVLLAVVAGMYAVYHGPDGLARMARRVHELTATLAAGLRRLGYPITHARFFDTLRVEVGARRNALLAQAAERRMNLRLLDGGSVGISLDETTTPEDLSDLLAAFAAAAGVEVGPARLLPAQLLAGVETEYEAPFRRTTSYLTHPVFHRYRSETEMLRYLKRLESRDLSLTTSMIPLGSCTMKLNAAAEMLPITWPEFARLHPFAPVEQAEGYHVLFQQLEAWLAEITGFERVSLQPNAGSQGELTGLLVIRRYHQSRGAGRRDVCLIPQSAHGTNPASAVMAGLRVVVVRSDERGNIDLADLRARAAEHAGELAALMITYPSTHGIFEEGVREICDVVHAHGGQVYMDGANMNAMVGLCRPGDFGADVAHLNLHKTFCIPHGGGGPGMGPIGVAAHLAPFLPGHVAVATGGPESIGAVAAAPWGSPGILPISWAYIRLMGAEGLKRASQVAILNANYVARRLEGHYPVLYRGRNGTVAHECIIDPRPLKASAGVEAGDIARRLMDYGFHAPTVSFPVPGTLMIEPTESESQAELDRFCDALISIREEIRQIEEGRMDRENNPLKNAPHTAEAVTSGDWARPYSREQAAFPAPWTREHKFWPAVGLIEAAAGDRNLVCACPPVEGYVPID
ncbi:MAG: aminomethyl-transferring glycine dehydrogenase [Gemmatimonadetes bacterium]|nr:aminomethyl-transferring glycine dehydrogenase [Gemmatimonadota bacterium]